MNSYIYNFHQKILVFPFSLKIIDDDKIYKQLEIFEIIKKLTVYFDYLGIKRNSRVALISKNKSYFLLVLYSLLYLKAIPVSIDYYSSYDIINKLVENEPFVISDKEINSYGGKLISIKKLLKKIEKIESVNNNIFFRVIHKNKFEKANNNDHFIILCSSGTTGFPKKVILSEKNIKWADKQYAKLYNFEKNNSIAFIVPTHYSLGILACGIIPFFHKKTILICDGRKIKKCLEKISEYKINILPATPTIYNLMNKCDLSKYDFSCLKVCDSGGQILPVSIIKKFEKNTSVLITEGYGLTETSSLTHFLISDRSGKLRLGSIGKPCNMVKCKIVDEKNNKIGAYIPGELLVKGPQNMLGYDDKEKNKEIFTSDGWLKTGDIVYRDNDNFYYLISRKIDLLEHKFINAKKLRKIEEILYSLDIVQECTTILTKNKKIIIFIKPANKRNSFENIKNMVYKYLPKTSLDAEIKLVNFIPRTSTYKVKRNILREKY